MNARALASASAVLLAAACSGGPGRPTEAPEGGNTAGAAGEPRAPRIGGFPGDGVPHSQFIDRIELAADGTAALTRDTGGSWRAWAALDGSAQPQAIAARGARQGSVARRAAGGLLVALVDNAGGLRLFRADERGRTTSVPLGSSERRVLVVRVLPGGERLLVLRDDHSIELMSDAGQVLTRLVKRGFRPAALEVGLAGDFAIAVMVEPGAKKHDVSIHRIDIAAGAAPALKLQDDPIRLSAPVATGAGQLSLSPGGGRLAFLEVESTQPWKLTVADLAARSTRSVDLPFQATEAVTAGFVDDDTLVASSAATATSWRIELERDGDLFPHPSPGNQFGAAAPSAFARGTRAAGVGNWLFVESVGSGKLYLGYDRFEAIAGTISPKKNWAAWVSNMNGVYIRGLGGARPARVHIPNKDSSTQVFRAMFVDEDHLLLIDSTGGMRLVAWASGEEIAATDLGGGFMDTELDLRRGLLRATRPGGQTWLYQVSAEKGLVGPLIVGDGGIRSGFLDGGDALWTLDGQNRYRTYKLDEVKRGLGRKAVVDRGVILEHASPVAIDRSGRFYIFYNDGRKTQVQRFSGHRRTDPQDAFTLSPTSFATVFPGDRGRVMVGRQDGVVSMFAGPGAKSAWSRAFLANLYGASYSQDGTLVAVSAHLGAAVLDVTTGKPVDVTCGPWFEVRRTAPSNAFGVLQQANLCESDWASE
ncbi:MAG TPA: hypothetical protein VFU21_25030 [Kofleriaceae bacterium]|nr:hypothetical protein [Kofleriaceae bacterium]